MTPAFYAALRWGAIVGGALGILETFTYLMVLRTGTAEDYGMLGSCMLLFEWGVPVAAGWLAAREAKEGRVGLAAGLVSAVIVALISLVYNNVMPAPQEFSGLSSPSDYLVSSLVGTIMTLVVGAVSGWLGGRFWERQAERTK